MPGGDELSSYRAKRDFASTPEPAGSAAADGAGAPRFVVQEHHASSLHWDLRLEHDGALASWAVPKGIPADPRRNHLAVRTEDHPLEYLEFHGEIPAGSYGAGTMTVWDRGTFEVHKWRDAEVMVTLHGERVQGRHVLFRTGGKNWMIHRMDPPADPGREPMPETLAPMLARSGSLPRDGSGWAYEIKWDGVRALAFCAGGRVALRSRSGRVITPQYPELRGLAEPLGTTEAILDGEVVAFDADGKPSFQALQGRMHVSSEAQVRRLAASTPVAYVAFDVLWRDGRPLLDEPYEARRDALEALGLAGDHVQVPKHHLGDGEALLEATRRAGLEGVMAKRLGSVYVPGRRTTDWVKVKNVRRASVVVGGWMPGEGGRSGRLGALCVGFHAEEGGLRYAGRVGTGFTETELERLGGLLAPLAADASPFTGRQPPRQARWVRPELVAEVEFAQWTQSHTLRAPSYKGLRDDVDARQVGFDPGA